ncbi:MAG: hypothetical protein A2X08_08615 [Bacteroidetes bacterium GWA2_32_17]|nr:MAG: hypothetical protein A2X08_08615 [Bacteroidetes bacterium GWA2_32_17]
MKNSILFLLLFTIIFTSCNNEVKTIESAGGIRIKLEVNNIDLLKGMCIIPEDSLFQMCLQKTSTRKYNSIEEFLESFNKAMQEINPSIKLASYFATFEMKDKIYLHSTNDKVLAVLKSELQKKLDETIINITKRLRKFSEQSANIKVLEYNLILVEVPGLFEKQRICNLLQSSGNLGFWETYENSEVYQYLDAANKKISELGLSNEGYNLDTVKKELSLLDEVNSNKDSVQEKLSKENPLFSILYPNVDSERKLSKGSVVGLSDSKDTAQVNKYLALRQVKLLFPYSLRFLWTLKPLKGTTVFQLIAIRVTSRNGLAPLDGSVITTASYSSNSEVSMSMNTEGARIWSRFTRDNVGKQIAIVIDNRVYSFPVVNQEIQGGNSSISGDFTIEEAEDMVNILNAGSCPVKLNVVAVDIIEPIKK